HVEGCAFTQILLHFLLILRAMRGGWKGYGTPGRPPRSRAGRAPYRNGRPVPIHSAKTPRSPKVACAIRLAGAGPFRHSRKTAPRPRGRSAKPRVSHGDSRATDE